MNALVLLAEGFEDIEAITVIDVLRRGGVTVKTASISASTEVESAHAVVLRADGLFSDFAEDAWDAIILPGGAGGTERLRANDAVITRLQRQKDEGRLICAICAAPLVLEEANVIDPEQQITCYPTCVMELERESIQVPVITDGTLITGQAPGSAMLFALVILKTLVGEATAAKVARALVTDVLNG